MHRLIWILAGRTSLIVGFVVHWLKFYLLLQLNESGMYRIIISCIYILLHDKKNFNKGTEYKEKTLFFCGKYVICHKQHVGGK